MCNMNSKITKEDISWNKKKDILKDFGIAKQFGDH